MSERNYLKTEAVFLAEKTPKKEVVVTPPLREDSLKVTENGTYQAPIGRGYTDVEVNVAGAEPFYVTLTKNLNDEYFTADKTNAEILEEMGNKRMVVLVENHTIFLVNSAYAINPVTGESRFKATIPNFGTLETLQDDYDNVTWEAVKDETIYWVNLTWDNDEGHYVADKTNNEILNAIRNSLVPYINFKMHGYPAYADFEFSSPILLAGFDETNNLSLFQSMMYVGDNMFTLYSTTLLPVSTNTNWQLGRRELASIIYVDEAIYYGITLTQITSGTSNNFVSNAEANEIIMSCAGNIGGGSGGEYRIPYIRIEYFNNTGIYTRNLEVGDDGTLNIIYYDTQKTNLCKLTHLPTDSADAWTRSIL